MRLFIASPAILYDYTALKADFSGVLDGKWVDEGNLHLTWVFLGNVASPEPVIEKMKNLKELQSTSILSGLGTFGRPPRILYAGSVEKSLYAKAAEFRKAGFDLYRFKPHVTLCRIKKIHDYTRFKDLKKAYRNRILGEIKPEISLYETLLTPKQVQYRKIQ